MFNGRYYCSQKEHVLSYYLVFDKSSISLHVRNVNIALLQEKSYGQFEHTKCAIEFDEIL